jgi:hypothetical protein
MVLQGGDLLTEEDKLGVVLIARVIVAVLGLVLVVVLVILVIVLVVALVVDDAVPSPSGSLHLVDASPIKSSASALWCDVDNLMFDCPGGCPTLSPLP